MILLIGNKRLLNGTILLLRKFSYIKYTSLQFLLFFAKFLPFKSFLEAFL